MASRSGSKDSNSSDDEIIFAIEKRKRKKRTVVSSDSDEDSEVEIRPKTRRGHIRLPKSDSDSDEQESIEKSRNTSNNHENLALGSDDSNLAFANESSDSETAAEKCPICFTKFLDQDLAIPEACDHIFCSFCLQEWAKKQNTCPIDRKNFDVILVRKHGERDFTKRVPVMCEPPIYYTDSDLSDASDIASDIFFYHCEICREVAGETALVFCNRCRMGYHFGCLEPSARNTAEVDDFDWCCPTCSPAVALQGEPRTTLRRPRRPYRNSSRTAGEASVRTYLQQLLEESSSSDNSDENDLNSVLSYRRQIMYEQIRSRRQSRFPSRRHVIPLPVVLNPMEPLDTSLLFGSDGDMGDLEYNTYDDEGSVLSRLRAQAIARTKQIITASENRFRANFRSPPPSLATSNDIVGEILEKQALLHTPGLTFLQRDGSLGPNSNTGCVGQQHPLSPTQSTPSKCNSVENSQPNSSCASSSSSAGASSQCQDLYSNLPPPVCNVLGNTSTDGYDSDSLSMVTHRSYGSTSIPDELQKENKDSAVHSKDTVKDHSDDDVDIYSDIEMANVGNNDDTSLDDNMKAMSMNCKLDDVPLPPPPSVAAAGDGTDSSDNDLIIDEERLEEDRDKGKYASVMKKSEIQSDINETAENVGSNASSPTDLNCDQTHKVDIKSIQSPDETDANDDESDFCVSSKDSFHEKTSVVVSGNSEVLKKFNDSDTNNQDSDSLHINKNCGNMANIIQANSFNAKLDSTQDKLSSEKESLNSKLHGDSDSECHISLVSGTFSQDKQTAISDIEIENEKTAEESEGGKNDVDIKYTDVSVANDENNSNCESKSILEANVDLYSPSEAIEDMDDSNESEGENSTNFAKLKEPFDHEPVFDDDDAQDEKLSSLDLDVDEKFVETSDESNSAFDPERYMVNADSKLPLIDDIETATKSVEQETENKEDTVEDYKTLPATCSSSENSQTECFIEGGNKEAEVHSPMESYNPDSQNIDLGIEDISDAASDDLHQPDSMDYDDFAADANQTLLENVERNVAQLFACDDASPENNRARFESGSSSKNEFKRYGSASRTSLLDDQEEGEIIEDLPYRKKSRKDHYHDDDVDEYLDSTPRVNISSLPRIPKIKRDVKKSSSSNSIVHEEPLIEGKRLSVMGRIDLGSSDISWKRLSQHTKERSYRDGRPKDEIVLFREREPRSKDKKSKSSSGEKRSEERSRDSEKNKRDDVDKVKKQETKSKDRSDNREKKSERSRNEYERSSKHDDWDYEDYGGEKRDKERSGKSHKESRYDRDKPKKDKKKDKSYRSSRDTGDKYDRSRSRREDSYEHSSDRYERSHERSREKDHKHKHKDRKSESTKKSKEEKHKRSHSKEHFSERQKDREVRKVDDKLKVVVEQKEQRKEKSERYFERKDMKHEKKHAPHHHHHECKKKEHLSPYNEMTPIESKEIFAQGDSIIINVNFNRPPLREISPVDEEPFCREIKTFPGDLVSLESPDFKDDTRRNKSKRTRDKEKIIDNFVEKCPTPVERSSQPVPVSESFWDESDDMKSPSSGKSPIGEKCSDVGDNSVSPLDICSAADNLSDSGDDLAENLSQDKNETSMPTSKGEKQSVDNTNESKETDSVSSSKRRSPQPPSPPSPTDNDSYDPCEPTRSPSPPPTPPAPPLPSTSDRPKPPPSPELPPLPLEPEPTDSFLRDDHKSLKVTPVRVASEMAPSVSASPITQQQQQSEPYTSTVEQPVVSNSVLPPPPSFPPKTPPRTVAVSHSQTVIPSTTSWQLPNPPPPPPMVFSSSHPQPVIRGNFLPSHFPTMGLQLQLPTVSAAVLPPATSVSLMSQVRQLQMSTHGIVPTNSLVSNIPINHLNIPGLQVPHGGHPITALTAHHQQIASGQNHPSPHSNGMASQGGIQILFNQGHPNISVSLPNQHVPMSATLPNQTLATHFQPVQNQVSVNATTHKNDALITTSPVKDSEVVDMDVDSPYSPGDSPSTDSIFDYSPLSSPVQKETLAATTSTVVKDLFDTLIDNRPTETTSKNRMPTNSSGTPSKKAKLDKHESSRSHHHTVRLQMTDKAKARKERKHLEKKELLLRLDDTQLKILDELPSSAVEMQVKEKYMKKLHRQERVVEEVKLALKPYYKTRDVSKEEYKDVLRKAVPKICHNKSGDINPVKVKSLIEGYVKKIKHAKKKAAKRRKAAKFS